MKRTKYSFILLLSLLLFGGLEKATVIAGATNYNLRSSGRNLESGNEYKWFVRLGGDEKHAGYMPSSCGGALVSSRVVLSSGRITIFIKMFCCIRYLVPVSLASHDVSSFSFSISFLISLLSSLPQFG